MRRELPDVFTGGDYLPLTTEITVPADVLAFTRMAGTDAVIVAAPRLSAGIGCAGPPLGADCWKTSRVMLPPVLRDRVFRDIFTGTEIRPTMKSDDAWIFVGQIFDQLPVAILRAT